MTNKKQKKKNKNTNNNVSDTSANNANNKSSPTTTATTTVTTQAAYPNSQQSHLSSKDNKQAKEKEKEKETTNVDDDQAVEEPQQKGFKGQAKKDMQAVEGYVAERAEGEGIDESKLDKALNIVNEEIVNEEKKRRNDQKLQKQKDSEKIKVSREDIEFIMKEMDVMKHEADKYLREHKGDLVEALKAMVNAC